MEDFYTPKSYRENGFIIIKNILNPQEVEEFAEEIKSYFSNIEQKAHNNELVNNRIMPCNRIFSPNISNTKKQEINKLY